MDENVRLHAESTVELIDGDRITVQSRGSRRELKVDAVVHGGRFANNALSEALLRTELADRTFTIGDAVRARGLYEASHDAAEAAQKIGLASGMAE